MAVARMRITPEGNEETFSASIGIYDKASELPPAAIAPTY